MADHLTQTTDKMLVECPPRRRESVDECKPEHTQNFENAGLARGERARTASTKQNYKRNQSQMAGPNVIMNLTGQCMGRVNQGSVKGLGVTFQ